MATEFYYPKRIESRADLAEAIAFMQRSGGAAHFRLPPMRALQAGRIAFLDMGAHTPARDVKAFLAIVRKPALVIVADDGDFPRGPEEMPQLGRLARWARQIIVHGAGGEVWQYELAVKSAEVVGRLLFIECPSRLVAAYQTFCLEAAPNVPGFLIAPPKGVAHPMPDNGPPPGMASC